MKKALSILLITFLVIGVSGFAFKKKKKQIPLVLAPIEYNLKPYNSVPGKAETNLVKLKKVKVITSAGVVSPDYQKMAFVQTGFLPSLNQIVPFLFYLNLDTDKNQKERVKTANISEKIEIPLEFIKIENQVFRTFTIVDWSADSQKLIVKEMIGENLGALWQTNVWIYDFNTQQSRNLNEIRKTVAFYWRNSRTLNLNNYTWDIAPLGWDANHPNRIVIKAFGIGKNSKKFLGLWSIDERGQTPYLLSLKDNQDYTIAANGFVLKKKTN